jgi:hypothetical protein
MKLIRNTWTYAFTPQTVWWLGTLLIPFSSFNICYTKLNFLSNLLERVSSCFDHDSTWARLLSKSSEEQSRPRSPSRSWRSHLPPEMQRRPLTSFWPYHTAGLNSSTQLPRYVIYKVVQIWPGLFVCKQVTVCPGHIWTTLYLLQSHFAR